MGRATPSSASVLRDNSQWSISLHLGVLIANTMHLHGQRLLSTTVPTKGWSSGQSTVQLNEIYVLSMVSQAIPLPAPLCRIQMVTQPAAQRLHSAVGVSGPARPVNSCNERETGSKDYTGLLQWVDELIGREHLKSNMPSPQNGSTIVQPIGLIKSTVPQTQVNRADLAATVFYSLRHNVLPFSNSSIIPGSSRAVVLANWLTMIQTALPASPQLSVLSHRLEAGAQISAAEWTAQIDLLELWGHDSEVAFYVCKGEYHGMACGLWQLFHSLTAAATDATAKDTLIGIRLFVANFFNCVSCQTHFAAVSAHVAAAEYHANRSTAMLWLWEVHNNISIRLAPQWGLAVTQATYPSLLACAHCQTHSEASTVVWALPAVQTFLDQTYTLSEHVINDEPWVIHFKWVALVAIVILGLAICFVLQQQQARRRGDDDGVPSGHMAVQLQEVPIDTDLNLISLRAVVV